MSDSECPLLTVLSGTTGPCRWRRLFLRRPGSARGMADAGDPVGDLHLAVVNASHRAGTAWLGVVSLCLVQFVDVLGVTVMVTALPAMLSDLHTSADAASLISTGYAMFFAGFLLLGARLGDRFGHRRIIFTGLATFTVAAVVGATATSAVVLTAARCLQGAAAALSVPSALRLLTTITSDGAPAGAGHRGLERVWGCRGRERICCRRRRDLSGRLAGGVLGLPSAGCAAGRGHRAGCAAGSGW